MGVHIYAGSLVRFYTNDWENEIKRWARESGVEYKSSGGPDRWPTVPEAREHLKWMRETLRERFGAVAWSDELDEYDTKKLHQEGRDALSIVAAHLHRPDLLMPDKLPDDMRADPAYDEAGEKGYLIGPIAAFDAGLIIPGDFDGLMFVESPMKEQVLVCSSQFLRNALNVLAEKYWSGKVEPDAWIDRGLVYARGSGSIRVVDGARVEELDEQPAESLRGNAEFAFGVYTRMLNFADRHRAAIAVW